MEARRAGIPCSRRRQHEKNHVVVKACWAAGAHVLDAGRVAVLFRRLIVVHPTGRIKGAKFGAPTPNVASLRDAFGTLDPSTRAH